MTERMTAVIERTDYLGKNPPKHTFNYDVHRFATQKYSTLERWEKIARSVADAIVNQTVYIYPEDRIIGRTFYGEEQKVECYDPDFYSNSSRAEMLEKHPEYAELCDFHITSWGIPGHIAWNWSRILTTGTSGMRELCLRKLERTKGDETARQFYTGVTIMLDALDGWNDLHVKRLEEMGKTEEAEICRRVPKYPARNFREAVQSFFMQHIVVMKENPFGGNSPGRLDYYLWPYLKADLNSGAITEEEATELVEELFLRIDERIHFNDLWGETVVVGGSHANGESAVNPLTYVMLKAFCRYDITHPYLYARVPKNAPEEYLTACAKYVIDSKNRGQVINDTAVVSALIKHGVTPADAYDYYCGGCMEVGVQGKTGDFLFTAAHSIPQILEFCTTGGYSLTKKRYINHISFKNLTDFDSFEKFYDYFRAECKRILHMHLEYLDLLSKQAEISRPLCLISSMIDGCMEKGRNMHAGGADYYDYGASLMGLPNVADSLTAIKTAVFEQGICSASELLDALKADFNGYEELQARLTAIPKFGQDDEEADKMAKRVVEDLCGDYASYVNRFGGYGKPVILSFIWAPTVGALLGATPDGRKAGVPVAQAVTPQSSAMTEGITVAMNSVAKLPFDCFPGGATTMWDLNEEWASVEVVEALIKVFFAKGGQFFQGNVTGVQELIDAKINPEKYPNLIVRVGGFSARFTMLNPELQDEIINRKRHGR